jgi:transcriptional regulator with XRE-family HTH domain
VQSTEAGNMKIKQFLEASLDELAQITGIDAPRWSRYFNGKNYSKKTLKIAASALDMDVPTLVIAIEQRNEANNKSLTCDKE